MLVALIKDIVEGYVKSMAAEFAVDFLLWLAACKAGIVFITVLGPLLILIFILWIAIKD